MDRLKNAFGDIAHVYARFNDNVAYGTWVDFTRYHWGSSPQKMLDAACGNGVLTRLFTPWVADILAIDFDPQMIQVAKAGGLSEVGLTFQVGNLVDLDVWGQDFDLITCYLDSICFLPSLEAIGRAFQAAYRALKPGGIYLFDVWTASQMQGFDDCYYYDKDNQAVLLWDSHLVQAECPTLIRHDIEVFEALTSQQETYRRLTCTLQEQTFPLKTYLGLLTAAGFRPDCIELYPDFAETKVNLDSFEEDGTAFERWVFKITK